MTIIEITALDNGSHRNQTWHGGELPEGWAVIGCETPNFPFGTPSVSIIDGVRTVTEWSAGIVPEPMPYPTPAPSVLDTIEAQVLYTALMTDTLLEEE